MPGSKHHVVFIPKRVVVTGARNRALAELVRFLPRNTVLRAVRHIQARLDRPRYDWSMKLKTSVTLSKDLVRSIARNGRRGESRSETIERLLRESLDAQTRRTSDLRDLETINRHAKELNAEAEDALGFQVEP